MLERAGLRRGQLGDPGAQFTRDPTADRPVSPTPAKSPVHAPEHLLERALALRGRHVVLYDGVCGLCNGLVRFVIRRDPNARFCYASLQSDFARHVLAVYDKDPSDLDTLYVIEHVGTERETLRSKSRAIVFIVSSLGGGWRAVGALRAVPRFALDLAYDGVAHLRYRFFGRHASCPLPSPVEAKRFIDV